MIEDFELIMRVEDHVEELKAKKERPKSNPQAAAANTRRARRR